MILIAMACGLGLAGGFALGVLYRSGWDAAR
jgi:hypothetical protein